MNSKEPQGSRYEIIQSNTDIGVTFYYSITDQIRIGYIYRELQSGNPSIAEIMERHGCRYYRLKLRYFRKYFGCTPKEMRSHFAHR